MKEINPHDTLSHRLLMGVVAPATDRVAQPEMEVIIQVGTGLPFAAVAREAEAACEAVAAPGKPVPAGNPVSYWRALRRAGIMDAMPERGALFTRP